MFVKFKKNRNFLLCLTNQRGHTNDPDFMKEINYILSINVPESYENFGLKAH